MKNLMVRTLSGAVLAVVVLGAVIWSQWSFGALLLAMLVAGMLEFYGLAEKQQVMEMTRRLLGLEKVPRPDDTADALAMAITFCHTNGSQLNRFVRRVPGPI